MLFIVILLPGAWRPIMCYNCYYNVFVYLASMSCESYKLFVYVVWLFCGSTRCAGGQCVTAALQRKSSGPGNATEKNSRGCRISTDIEI